MANTVTLDELVKEVGIPKSSLRKRCTDDHLSDVSIFLDWRAMAPRLGLDEAETEAIAEEGRTEAERRLKTLRRWKAKYGFKATYRRLVKALLAVGRADHAEDVCRLLAGQRGWQEKATLDTSSEEDTKIHTDATSNESNDSVMMSLESSSEDNSEDTDFHTISATRKSDLPGSLPERKRQQGPPRHRISKKKLKLKLRSTLPTIQKRKLQHDALRHQAPRKKMKLSYQIKELDQHFRSLVRRAASSFENVDLFQLKVHLIQLPVTMQHRHMRFLSGNSESINRAETSFQIFEILGRYWNFFNYGLLEHIIAEFGSKKLIRDMKKYEKRIKNFRAHTKVGEFIQEWSGKRPPNSSDFTIELIEEWKDRSLEELEQFQKDFALRCAIEPYLKPPLISGATSSLFLSWGLQDSFAISDLTLFCNRMDTRHFLERHGVLMIRFRGVHVFECLQKQEARKLDAKRTHRRQLFSRILESLMIMFTALMIWKGLMVITNCEGPVSLIMFGSAMEPTLSRGDLLFLTNYQEDPIQAGEILVFKVKDRDIIRRVMRVHETASGDLKVLTKGDNPDYGDDREEKLYAPGQMWVTRDDIVGRVRGRIPYVGMIPMMIHTLPRDYPVLSCIIIGGLYIGMFIVYLWKKFVRMFGLYIHVLTIVQLIIICMMVWPKLQ